MSTTEVLPFTIFPYFVMCAAPFVVVVLSLWPMLSLVVHAIDSPFLMVGVLFYVLYALVLSVGALKGMFAMSAFEELGKEMYKRNLQNAMDEGNEGGGGKPVLLNMEAENHQSSGAGEKKNGVVRNTCKSEEEVGAGEAAEHSVLENGAEPSEVFLDPEEASASGNEKLASGYLPHSNPPVFLDGSHRAEDSNLYGDNMGSSQQLQTTVHVDLEQPIASANLGQTEITSDAEVASSSNEVAATKQPSFKEQVGKKLSFFSHIMEEKLKTRNGGQGSDSLGRQPKKYNYLVGSTFLSPTKKANSRGKTSGGKTLSDKDNGSDEIPSDTEYAFVQATLIRHLCVKVKKNMMNVMRTSLFMQIIAYSMICLAIVQEGREFVDLTVSSDIVATVMLLFTDAFVNKCMMDMITIDFTFDALVKMRLYNGYMADDPDLSNLAVLFKFSDKLNAFFCKGVAQAQTKQHELEQKKAGTGGFLGKMKANVQEKFGVAGGKQA
eukprot:g16697.t1